MASKNECEICCKNTWVFECGANNNCNKKVCDECFLYNPNSCGEDCMFCFSKDIKRELRLELTAGCLGEKAEMIMSRYYFLSFPQCIVCETEEDFESQIAVLAEINKLKK